MHLSLCRSLSIIKRRRINDVSKVARRHHLAAGGDATLLCANWQHLLKPRQIMTSSFHVVWRNVGAELECQRHSRKSLAPGQRNNQQMAEYYIITTSIPYMLYATFVFCCTQVSESFQCISIPSFFRCSLEEAYFRFCLVSHVGLYTVFCETPFLTSCSICNLLLPLVGLPILRAHTAS